MPCSEKALLSAEMLNMLNMLNVFWPMRLPLQTMGFNGPKNIFNIFNIFNISAERNIFSEPYIQHDSTYSTFQQKEAFFFEKSFFLLKCCIRWMYWASDPKVLLNWRSVMGQKHSTYSTYSTSQQKEAFLSEPYIQHDSTYSTFQQKEAFLGEKTLLSAEMLNMLNVLGLWSEISVQLEEPHGPKNIQHIQHFSRKKRFFGTLDPTWFNIFNISAERSPWHLQNARNARFARFLGIL